MCVWHVLLILWTVVVWLLGYVAGRHNPCPRCLGQRAFVAHVYAEKGDKDA